MSTILNLGNNYHYNFSESRLNRVMNAETLAEAQNMGLWDRIKDFFHCGVKRQAIEILFDHINQPACHDTSPNKQLLKFERLIDLAKPEHKKDFTIDADPPNVYGKWNYRLQIAEHTVYQANEIVDSPTTSYGAFCAVMTGMAFRQYISDNPNIFGSGNDSNDDHIRASIQCMSDNEKIRQQLEKDLDNPKYGHKNFCAIEEVADSAKFIARFKEGSLEFSNRDNLHGEFRGALLKNALQSGNYHNLRELCLQGNNRTEQNTMLKYAAAPHIDIFIQSLTKGNPIDWPNDRYDPIKILIENKSPLISAETIQSLNEQVIGDTTLGKLFGIPQPDIDDADGKHRNTILDKRV